MDWTTIITAVVTAIVSLATGIPITARATKAKANAEAMQTVQDVYQQALEDLRNEKNRQREEFLTEISALRHAIEEQRTKAEQNSKDIASLQQELDQQRPWLCYANCTNRQKQRA